VWINSEKDIIDAIKDNGSEVAYINTINDVNGHYYMLGGRDSIKTALSQVNGEFKSTKGALRAEMMRFSHSLFSKTYTLIHITDVLQGVGGLKIRGWTQMNCRGTFVQPPIKSAITFKELVNQMNVTDAKFLG